MESSFKKVIEKRLQHRFFPGNIAKVLRKCFFIEHFRWLLLTVLPKCNKVSCGVLLFDLRLHVLPFWSKSHTKRCSNNPLISRDKIIYPLNWLIMCFRFQNVLKKLCLLFMNLHKALYKELYNFTCQKTFFACTLRLIKCPQFQDMIWKTEDRR